MAARVPDNRELLALARAWAEANHPGCPLISITLRLQHLPLSIRLVNGPAIGHEPRVEEDERATEHFSQCIVDILTALETARKPLTETRLLAELARAGKEWGRRTVEGYLKQMVDDGTITNPKGAKPPGYRLPEWDPS